MDIGVPEAWRSLDMRSVVLTGFESLQLREDHRPVLLSIAGSRLLRQDAYHTRTRRAVRPIVPSDPAVAAQTVARFTQLVTAPWHAPVDHQYDAFVQAWTFIGRSLQDKPQRQPVQSFVSEQALEYIDLRKALRHYLQQEDAEWNRRLLLVSLAAFIHHWRGTSFTNAHRQAAGRWLSEIDQSRARAAALLRHYARQVRQQVARDRCAYLASLTQQVQDASTRDPRSLYRAARKAFPSARSSRKSSLALSVFKRPVVDCLKTGPNIPQYSFLESEYSFQNSL